MRLFKAFLPTVIVFALAIYTHLKFNLLSESLANALQYLPILLIFFVGLIAVHFNQGRLFVFVFILSILFFSFTYSWLDTELKISLTAVVILTILVLTTLIREQGIISFRALPLYVLIIFLILFSLWIARENPFWATDFLNKTWFPEHYFQWTDLTQSILIFFVIAFIILFALLFLRQDGKSASAFSILIITVITFQRQASSTELMILISSGLLICLITILQESWRMAYVDELTQLPGRRALTEKLQSLVGIYTLAMVDVDFFKKFNDSYGHDTGDDVLRMIAAKLAKVSGGGSSYRYGGEEFTIVFTNKSIEQTQEHLQRVREDIAATDFVVNRRNLKKSVASKNKIVNITVSIGACDSIDISSNQEVLKRADAALYKAKKNGRNCVVS